MTREIQLYSVYRHFKGNYYYVEDCATDSESGETVVIYRPLYGERRLWVRPLSMFLSVQIYTLAQHEGISAYQQQIKTYLTDAPTDDAHHIKAYKSRPFHRFRCL